MKTVSRDTWKEGLETFREKTEAFYAGELDKNAYKGFSGKYGSYAQRGGKASMLRLRLTGGILTKDKLAFIADSIEEHGIQRIHITTCQTVQLHDLQPAVIYQIMEKALDHGIVTMGGGGDYPRNVMMSPLSGVGDGYLDVVPYVEAAGAYLLNFIEMEKMPRKLKVCFSDSPANVPHATYRDLGFVARPDGKFDVYSAGGLGANPRFGLKVGERVEPDDILYYIRAMWQTFRAYGNYENRAKARTRYMQQTLGEEGYVEKFKEELEKVYASGEDLSFSAGQRTVTKTGDGTAAEGGHVIFQKQEGLYAVHYHPLGGMVKPSKFREIYDAIKDMEQVELRLSPDESIYIINLTGGEVRQIEPVLEDGARDLFETSVACIGAGICQVGVRDSQKLLRSVIEAVRKAELPDGALPQIHISGCPSSCGTHQTGSIGFRGGVKMIDKVANPSFTMYVNGCDLQGEEQMGREVGQILEKDIPKLMVEIGKTVAASGLDYAAWMKENEKDFDKIVGKYRV